MYDKLRELQDHRSGSMEKRLILEQERWKCSPSEAWRFEFQVRREALRQFEVDSFEDWQAKRQDVIKYLTEQWIRFTDDKPTKGNAARSKTSATWLSVVAGFVDWAGRSALQKVVRAYKKSVDGMGDTQRRVRAAVSSLVGVAVEELGGDLNSFFAQDVVERLIQAAFKVDDFDEAVYRNVRKVMKRTLVPDIKRPMRHYQDFLNDLSTKALSFQEEYGTASYYEDEIEFSLA